MPGGKHLKQSTDNTLLRLLNWTSHTYAKRVLQLVPQDSKVTDTQTPSLKLAASLTAKRFL